MSTGRPTARGHQTLDEVAAKALQDDQFKQELIEDPHKVLGDHGLTVRQEVTIHVHVNTEAEIHLVLPTRPNAHAHLDPDDTDISHLSDGVHF